MSNNPEFFCDPDLEPLVTTGQLTEFEAMAIMTNRNTARLQEAVERLEKKLGGQQRSVLVPRYRGIG